MRLCALTFVAGLAVGCEALRPAPKNPSPTPPPRGEGLQTERPSLSPPSFPGKGVGGLGSSPVEILRTSAQQPAVPVAAQVVPEDPLVLVAKCLERADHRGAAIHLETYVRAHPDQPLFRLQLAELYARCDRPADARFHYERFVVDAQGVAALAARVVAAHIKVMEMAQ